MTNFKGIEAKKFIFFLHCVKEKGRRRKKKRIKVLLNEWYGIVGEQLNKSKGKRFLGSVTKLGI